MSIIHDALKKAAAEKNAPLSHPASLEYHSEKTSGLKGPGGMTLFLLFLLFLSAWFYFHKQEELPLSFRQTVVPFESASGNKISASKEISHEETAPPESISESRNEQGQRALLEGLKQYRQGKYDHAVRLFSEAVTIPSLSAVAHNNLGMTLRLMGKVDEAITHYKEAIRLDPNYAEAHNNLGMAQVVTGLTDQAGTHYKKAINLMPSTPAFHLNYATWLEQKGSLQDALMQYRSFLRLSSKTNENPTDADIQNNTLMLVRSRLKQLEGSNP
ncbi:MAG: tetratricopeptide repeat protein [Nitrospiria bacterium]